MGWDDIRAHFVELRALHNMLIIVITSGCKNIPFLNVWIHILVT